MAPQRICRGDDPHAMLQAMDAKALMCRLCFAPSDHVMAVDGLESSCRQPCAGRLTTGLPTIAGWIGNGSNPPP